MPMKHTCMRHATGRLLLGAILALSLQIAVGEEADVYLKDGRRLHGDVTQTETEVTVNTPAGPLKLDRADVIRIVARRTPDDEYLERFKAIKADDIAGHFEIVEWARGIERWDIVARQCKYILGIDPTHANAKLRLEQAQAALADQANEKTAKQSGKSPNTDGEAKKDETEADGAPVPLLGKQDILRLKLFELSLLGDPEDLRVKFKTKRGQGDVARQFVEMVRGQENFDANWEQRFLRSKPNEQLRDIARVSGAKFADQIEIDDDPAVFSTFRRKILPLIARGCIRSGCHGSAAESDFRLPAASRGDAAVYTAFALLDATYTRYGPLLNRDDPNASVLLSFMMPQEGNDQPHPPVKRGARVAPVIRSSRDTNYDLVQRWIASLRVPHPEYGLEYALPRAPSTQPASMPASAPKKRTQSTPAGNEEGAPRVAGALEGGGDSRSSVIRDKPPGEVHPRLAEDARSPTVYVTKSGEKYHRADCSFLKNSSEGKSLKDAKAAGKTPCSRCKPPT